jgi:hypothetical protein
MAIQYYMRAFNTSTQQYVDWIVNDTPDSTGVYSGFPVNQLVNITINRVVQSKISNFLKPTQSLMGNDGYYLHVNAYDWKNAVAPLGFPTTLVGFAVERGIASVTTIIAASNTTPISIHTQNPHFLSTGQLATIIGVTGNINANGTWPVTVQDSTHFTLNGSSGSGNPNNNTGVVFVPNDFSTLMWDEGSSLWRFVANTHGDGTTLGASQSIKFNAGLVDGYLAIGPAPAQNSSLFNGYFIDAIRLSNNQYIFARDSLNTADVQLIGLDTFVTGSGTNRIKIGNLSTDVQYDPGIIQLDGYLEHTTLGVDGAIVAQSGFIRDQNNTTVVAVRNSTQNGDLAAISSTSTNNLVVGDANNATVQYNTATGGVHQFQVNSTSQVELGTAFIRFTTGPLATNPTIYQNTATIGISGQPLTLQAQSAATTGSGVGGNLNLQSGSGFTNSNGLINLQTFNNTLAVPAYVTRVSISDSTETYSIPNLLFTNVVPSPFITQSSTSASTTALFGATFPVSTIYLTSNTGFAPSGSATIFTSTGLQTINYTGNQVTTTIASGSNGVSLPQATIFVASVTGFSNTGTGTITVLTSTGLQTVTYTSTTGGATPSFNGCSGGTGTMTTGNLVSQAALTGVTGGASATTYSASAAVVANGQNFTVQAQGTTITNGIGGNLVLSSGMGTVIANDGYVILEAGGQPQMYISAVNTPPLSFPLSSGKVTITGDLEVQGTITTVDSTTVDIIGAVIHGNWSDPTVPANANVSVPQTVAGYAVHRGNLNAHARDGANWIWTEDITIPIPNLSTLNGQYAAGNGYWRAISTPGDGYGLDNTSAAISTGTLGVLGNNYISTTDPNPVTGTTPVTGGFRSINNVASVVARNLSTTTTIAAASNLQTLPSATTINVASTSGFTTSGSLLVQVTGATSPQTVTYTGGGGGGTQFTGVSGGTGTLNTGGYVGQTNASTTIAAASNGVSLPTSTISVASTLGFPPSGTLRIVTGTPGVAGGTTNVVAYTGITPAGGGALGTFTGCSGGTGTMSTGNTVTLAPIVGSADLVLAGTDFGNHILWGSPSNNTGHIFNTPATFIYDFQASSVSQVQLANTVAGGDGYTQTIAIGPTVSNPKIFQLVQPNTGSNPGSNLKLHAQAGQQQTGSAANNNGGNLALASGVAGTGGSGAAGINGQIEFFWGNTLELTLTDGSLQWSNLITNAPTISQADGVPNGQTMTIQAQNGTSTGGILTLTSGTGSTTSNAGNVQIQTGAVTRVLVTPTFTSFSDTAEALRITPVSAGTTQITYAATDTAAQINQTQTTTANGAPMTIQSQVTTLNSGIGGALSIIAGNATGTTTTGGALNLASGSGTTTNGVINFQPGGTTQVLITATGQFIQWVSTLASPTLNQATTAGASGQTLTVQAQNATTTGGLLTLTSGTGATAGNVQLQTGAVTRVLVTPTFTSFSDTAEALRITPVSAGTTQITFASTDTAASINQTTTAGATGANMTLQAQNAATTGGNAIITSGTGVTAGNVLLETGGTARVTVSPTNTQFADTATALTITPVSAGTTQITFASTDTAAQINQTATAGASGATMTIAAQNAVTTGGNLFLSSGVAATDGYVALQVGGSTNASVTDSKFVLNKGWRRNITQISATYAVQSSDDYIAITSISAPFTITLPASPTLGDSFTFKDASGTAATNNVIISGNGNNIDGAATVTLSQNYSALVLTFTGTTWSIS